MILKKEVAESDDIKPAGGPGMLTEYKNDKKNVSEK